MYPNELQRLRKGRSSCEARNIFKEWVFISHLSESKTLKLKLESVQDTGAGYTVNRFWY